MTHVPTARNAAIVATIATFCTFPAQAATPRILLECYGRNLLNSAKTEHEVAIFQTTAEFDGRRFQLAETATEFTLTGPVPTNDVIVYINRLTGEYAITPASTNSGIKNLEDSEKGDGCKKMMQKF